MNGEEWSRGWNAAIDYLRCLPVEQRMEAMGMVQYGGGTAGGRPIFVEHWPDGRPLAAHGGWDA